MNPYLVIAVLVIVVAVERFFLWRASQLLSKRIVTVAMDRVMQQCIEHEIPIQTAVRCLEADLEHGPRHLLDQSCWDKLVGGHKPGNMT